MRSAVEQPPSFVSIIVPVRNEQGTIASTLDAILEQDIDEPFEIVIADGGSTDSTPLVLAEYEATHAGRVRVVANPAGGTPQALNVLLAAARGDVIVRIDAHSSPPKDYVRHLVGHIRAGECEGAGAQKRAVGRGSFGQAVALAHSSKFGIGDSKYHYATEVGYVDHVPFGAYLREKAREIGGWDENLVRNQDYDFDYRYGQAGGRLLLDPRVVIDWNVREHPRALARQYFEYGYWKYRVLQKHPSSLHLRWLIPPAFVAVLGVGVPAAVVWPAARVAVGGIVVAYLVFLAGAVITMRPRARGVASRLPLAIATMHVSWGAGFLASAVRRVGRR